MVAWAGAVAGPDMRRILPVVGVVVLVLVLGFVVLGSCGGTSKADKYRSYVSDVNSVARGSNADAKTLDTALYNQELTPNQLLAKVTALIPRASAAETTAAALKPPGKIGQQGLQRYLLQALQYRTLGLQDLQAALKTAFAGAANTKATEAQRTAVAAAYADLIGSDVVYAASFQRPLEAILKAESVTDAPLTQSLWALSPELANPSENSNGAWIESVRDAGSTSPCADGAIGTSIDGVKANGKTLQAGSATGGPVTTVQLKIPSTFTVTVANHGNCPVRGISVHLTEGNQRTQNQKIKSLLPNETVTRTFPATGNPGEAKIDVAVPPVSRGEEHREQPLHLPRRLPELGSHAHERRPPARARRPRDRGGGARAGALGGRSGCAACGAPRARCSRAGRSPTSSSSRSACRRGRSTSSGAPTSSRRASRRRAATSASRCSASGCSASTPTTAPRACSRPRSPCSTRAATASS